MKSILGVLVVLLVAGCVHCPTDQELANIAGDAQFNTGYLYIGFEANSSLMSKEDQEVVIKIASSLWEELQRPRCSDVYVYVATGHYEGDDPNNRELARHRFDYIRSLLEKGGITASRIRGSTGLPKRDQLKIGSGVYIGLRCG